MRVAICDDVPEEAEEVSALLERYRLSRPALSMDISLFWRAEDLLAGAGADGAAFDLYLLDILMEGRSGIELAEELRRSGYQGRIVFLTSSPDYALEAFAVHASDYLLKPVSGQALGRVLDEAEEALALFQRRRQRRFTFRTPDGLCTVPLESVVYVEVLGHTPYYHLTEETVRGSEMRVSFETGMAELIESGRFLRSHRSFLVHIDHISAVYPQALKLDDGTQIPVARTRAQKVRSCYLDHLTEGRRQS